MNNNTTYNIKQAAMKNLLAFIFLTFFVFIGSFSSYGQDSIVVYQQESWLFTNFYVFYSDNTFKHYYFPDVGVGWYGKGIYKDKGKKRVLEFGNPDTTFKIELGEIHYESNFKRTLKITGKQFVSKDYYFTTKDKSVIFSER